MSLTLADNATMYSPDRTVPAHRAVQHVSPLVTLVVVPLVTITVDAQWYQAEKMHVILKFLYVCGALRRSM